MADFLPYLYVSEYFYRYPDKAPFRLDGEREIKYISRGRGQSIPVRIKTDSWDLEKTFKLTFLEKIIEISAD